MSKTNRELYKDISKIFVENGVCSTDFAKLTELYRRSEMKGMVPLDEVENLAEKYGDPYEIIRELKEKFGLK